MVEPLRQELCYGIAPLQWRQELGGWSLLLVQLHSGRHWGFPKGHAEPGELPLQTAARELKEETGLLLAQLLSEQGWMDGYQLPHPTQEGFIDKKVVYFLALVSGTELCDAAEVMDSRWLPIDQVESHLTYEGLKQCWRQMRLYLSSLMATSSGPSNLTGQEGYLHLP